MGFIKGLMKRIRPGGCHGGEGTHVEGLKKLVLVGSPNVGKSVLFNNLTGNYVAVSNYPGTTVHVSRGRGKMGTAEFEIIDTPGMFSLCPITEEERVARFILLKEHPEMVIHVTDARNLERMLPLTLQLIEAGLPVILDLNMMDEAERIGLKIDTGRLEEELGIPVVATVSILGRGVDLLKAKVEQYACH